MIQAADAHKTHLAHTRLNQEEGCFSGFKFSEEKLRETFLVKDFIFAVETRNYLQQVVCCYCLEGIDTLLLYVHDRYNGILKLMLPCTQ